MRQHKALEEIMLPVVAGLGYNWVGLQVVPHGKHTLLRLFIDKPGGVTIDDCSIVSRQLNAVLSVEGIVKGEYTLEVSSPGLDRLFFTIEQCTEQIGKQINVRLIAPKDGRRNFKGKLLHIKGEDLTMEITVGTENEVMTFSFSDVHEARLVPEW